MQYFLFFYTIEHYSENPWIFLRRFLLPVNFSTCLYTLLKSFVGEMSLYLRNGNFWKSHFVHTFCSSFSQNRELESQGKLLVVNVFLCWTVLWIVFQEGSILIPQLIRIAFHFVNLNTFMVIIFNTYKKSVVLLKS